MIRLRKKNNFCAQTVVEYTVVIASVLGVMAAMGPMIRRASQGYLKLVADQVGVQNEADQRFNDMTQSHLVSSYSADRRDINKTTQDVGGIITYVFGDATDTTSNAVVNLGIQPDP